MLSSLRLSFKFLGGFVCISSVFADKKPKMVHLLTTLTSCRQNNKHETKSKRFLCCISKFLGQTKATTSINHTS